VYRGAQLGTPYLQQAILQALWGAAGGRAAGLGLPGGRPGGGKVSCFFECCYYVTFGKLSPGTLGSSWRLGLLGEQPGGGTMVTVCLLACRLVWLFCFVGYAALCTNHCTACVCSCSSQCVLRLLTCGLTCCSGAVRHYRRTTWQHACGLATHFTSQLDGVLLPPPCFMSLLQWCRVAYAAHCLARVGLIHKLRPNVLLPPTCFMSLLQWCRVAYAAHCLARVGLIHKLRLNVLLPPTRCMSLL
jgi:hypothetical protein